MKIQQLLYNKELGSLRQWLSQTASSSFTLHGLTGSASSVVLASVMDSMPTVTLVVMDDEDEAAYLYNDLRTLTASQADCDILFFPAPNRRSARMGQRDTANIILRTEVIGKMVERGERREERGEREVMTIAQEGASEDTSLSKLLLITYPEALAAPVPTQELTAENALTVKVGDEVSFARLTEELDRMGFIETEYVYEPGQYAQRGSILDIYSFTSEYPLRIDFFGDEVDSIRTFDVQSQLSQQQLRHVVIAAAEDKLTTQTTHFLNLLPQDALLIAHDLDFVEKKMQQAADGQTDSQDDSLFSAGMFDVFRHVLLRPSSDEKGGKSHPDSLHFNMSPQPLFHKNMTLLRETLDDYLHRRGYRLILLAESRKQIERITEIINAEATTESERFSLRALELTLHEGFIDHRRKLCVLTDHQIFDRFHKYALRSDIARQGKMALTLREIKELDIGDFLVHIDFGIGKFGGLVRVPTDDSYQEMIRIVYQRGDTVDVSIHNLYKISKYRRSDTGEPPRLSTLGTGAWERMKERTKRRLKDIARDLIRLYAQRRKQQGFAFGADTFMQHELEASFIYEDTPDQLTTTADVKADMESRRPMDRLICGDVGFGKTEIAVRAAFKAACDGKQVAVLVPTTVLCMQHYHTFSERLKQMPVRVDYLSRARTPKQTKDILADLKAGKIDILIGTHKLTGAQVQWKDLGLLIIDEEQKFGVAAKEKLRTLRANIDTLTLTATPIPRTLQFSLMGARDMSVMRTPPPNRYPIYTELITLQPEIIADAIRDEMSRNGQVFYVNHRINGLEEIARMLHRHMPEARVVIAHGQMPPSRLEDIIMAFIRHEFDVLLSTTIIENGIDIPNANTIIINGAHQFGLSDLHQMRGRVGRTNRKAYCYLIAPPKDLLPADTRRRLEALETFAELGSGFNIALQDLDIRGAGNLLGAEQSGFIEDLGYDTYQRILTQAVRELREEERELTTEMRGGARQTADIVDDCTIESDMAMYLPDSYVPGSSERLLLYRELQTLVSDEELAAYRQRLQDRFGKLPREGEELLQVVRLRRLGKQLGCEKIVLKQRRLQLQFVSNPDSDYYQSDMFGRIIDYAMSHVQRCLLRETNDRRMMNVVDVASARDAVILLQEMIGAS